MAIGRALGLSVGGPAAVLVGRDTRRSGRLLESALAAGIASAGVDVVIGGVLPTPAVAELVAADDAFGAGVVISASHNPFPDNGIKVFGPDGFKLPDHAEAELEALVGDPDGPRPTGGDVGEILEWDGAADRYCETLIARAGVRLDGLRVAIDCAHGATVVTAPRVLEALGAEVVAIGTDPDGVNINVDCGSTHLGALQALVRESGADVGLAFDGDGDRVSMVDHTGEIVDGDEILYIIARHRLVQGAMRGGVVGTLMSNLGLERALGTLGIPFVRANVGDRYIMERLQAEGWMLGGESSGHILCLDRTTTGDGIISALQALSAMRDAQMDLATLRRGLTKFPQLMVNVKAAAPGRVRDSRPIADAVAAAECALRGRGRVLLRPSGTEPVVRVMVEGEDRAEVQAVLDDLAASVRTVLAG